MFLIIVGGDIKTEQKDVGGGVMEWFDRPVTDPNITMVVELGKIIHIRKIMCTMHTQIRQK